LDRNGTAPWVLARRAGKNHEIDTAFLNAGISSDPDMKSASTPRKDRFDTAIRNVRFAAADYRKSTALQ